MPYTFSKIWLLIIFITLLVGGIFLGYQYLTNNEEAGQMNIAAGVVPHHLLAEDIIQDFFNYISLHGEPETIILLSPDHFNVGGSEFIGEPSPALKIDHGITNLVPFIQEYFPASLIKPFLIPQDISLEKAVQFAVSLDSQSPRNTVVIASVDFSHYLPASAAQFHDVKSIRTLINFEEENFENIEVDSWQALYIARLFAKLRNKESAKIIAHKNASDFLENGEEVTSYFSLVFEEGDFTEEKEKTILFLGDIMLDRGVEYLMKKNSDFYPLERISQFLKGIDIVVGNLEGPIMKNPPYFPDDSLKFAFSPEAMKTLSLGNFNLVSLANNHTFDLVEAGLQETKELLTEGSVNFVGHPIQCDQDVSFKQDDVIFLAFNKTYPFNCSNEEIAEIVRIEKEFNSDKFLIVIFHWGEEYYPKSLISQQSLAHQIIEAGADLIIGSHSHVVQEIEEYQGKLIFYSLGNFIFDQYFSTETQQGLAVGLELQADRTIFRLFPIQSHLSQPFLMEKETAEDFLSELAQKSSQSLSAGIEKGIIELSL